MSTNVTLAKLGSHIRTQKGFAFKSKWYTDVGVPIVKVSDFTEDSVDASNLTCIPKEIAADYSRFVLTTGDIVIQTVGSWPTNPKSVVGKVIRVPSEASGALLNQNAVRIDPDRPLDKRFLFFLLKSDSFKDYIVGGARGAASQASITLEDIREFSFILPPLPTQRKIAAILSAYDDLIENNTRRIAILEEMAQALYREWFVHFRFPGHEDVPLVDSLMGPIPEGWEAKPIGEAAETLGGGTPSTKRPEYWEDGEVVWFTPSDLTSNNAMFISKSSRMITALGLQRSSARLFPAYSVMMASRATIGITALNTTEACTNQGFITCIPNEGVSAYELYFWIQENKEAIVAVASGATFKEINRTEFREFPIVIADGKTSARFNGTMTPIGNQIENLLTRNANLRRTRDLLLPRLISGQIDVSGLPIDTGGLEP